MITFNLITLFPEACDVYLSASILGRARAKKQISVAYQNPRDFVTNPGTTTRPVALSGDDRRVGYGAGKWFYRKVDDKPYGGGPGMVMQALPIVKAVERSLKMPKSGRRMTTFGRRGKGAEKKAAVVWFSPVAKQFTNKDADTLATFEQVVFVCGRYEGIDERAKKMLKAIATGSAGRVKVREFAVGEAVYTGGELPAMAMVDAITRRLPGVLGKDASVEERRIASHAVYTRPETIEFQKKKYRVPKVLQTGNHAKMDAWRAKHAGRNPKGT